MKKRGRGFRKLVSNFWKDKRTTVLGALGASLLLIGQYLMGGQKIDWRACIGAFVLVVAGSLSNTKTNKNEDHGKEQNDEVDSRADSRLDGNSRDILQSQDDKHLQNI